MIIRDLEFQLIRVPNERGYAGDRLVLVRLLFDADLEGWGEAALPWRITEPGPRRDFLLPILAGRNVFDIAELLELEPLYPRALKAAVETACWDALGRAAGQPVARLMGGVYRQRIPCSLRLRSEAPEDLAAETRRAIEAGHTSLVVAGSGYGENDVRRLKTVRAVAGPHASLRFDAAGLLDLPSAVRLARELEAFESILMIDPLRRAGWDLYYQLQRQIDISIAACRQITGPADVFAAARAAAVDHVIIDLARVGGILRARDCVTVAEAANLGCSLSCDLSVGFQSAAALQLASALPALTAGHDLPSPDAVNASAVRGLKMMDGMFEVPLGPGLGIEVDREEIDGLAVSRDVDDLFPQ
ncbi:MAG: hypothetical protein GYA33_14800 [Thermogutta sp.]|nr:hypothetical protein [Thermogutta sp.]